MYYAFCTGPFLCGVYRLVIMHAPKCLLTGTRRHQVIARRMRPATYCCSKASREMEKDFVLLMSNMTLRKFLCLSLFPRPCWSRKAKSTVDEQNTVQVSPLKAPPASRKLTAAGFTGAPNISPIFHNLGPSSLSGSVRTFNIKLWFDLEIHNKRKWRLQKIQVP